MTLYQEIGEPFVTEAIRVFYTRAFNDIIIGHLFLGHDQEALTLAQTTFAISMLGGPRHYRGKALAAAHYPLKLKPAHFGRRQVLMSDVLIELGLSDELREKWLAMEEQLRPLIIQDLSACRD